MISLFLINLRLQNSKKRNYYRKQTDKGMLIISLMSKISYERTAWKNCMIELHFSRKISFNNTKSYILLKNKKLEIFKSRAKYAYAMHADTLFQLPKTTQKKVFLSRIPKFSLWKVAIQQYWGNMGP